MSMIKSELKKLKAQAKPGIGPTKECAFIGAPMAEGQGLRGVDLCPTALRESGLPQVVERLQWKWEDRGDVDLAFTQDNQLSPSKRPASPAKGGNSQTSPSRKRKDAEETADVYYDDKQVKNAEVCGEACRRIYEACYAAAKENKFVLTAGGDHSIAAGSIAGQLKARPNLAVVWIDAHGDANTPETSPSGNYHGMPAAHLMGWFKKHVHGFGWRETEKVPILPETNIAFIGLRDLDAQERQLLLDSKVTCFSMQDVDKYGIGKIMEMAIEAVDPHNDRPLHLSFDIDACDPSVAPGTGTKARGGLTYREAHYICESMADTGRLTGMDIVEINPAIDVKDELGDDLHGDDPLVKGTATVKFGIELIQSALGKTIL